MADSTSRVYRDRFFNDGNSYAYVTGEGEKGIHYSGGWFDGSREEIDKARKVAHGDFLWFERDGKSYVIDDAATLARSSPCRIRWTTLASSRTPSASSRKNWASSRKRWASRWSSSRFPLPTCSKELAKLQAGRQSSPRFRAKMSSQQQLGEIEGELAQIQGQLGALQGQMGGREGELGGKMGELGRAAGQTRRPTGPAGRAARPHRARNGWQGPHHH